MTAIDDNALSLEISRRFKAPPERVFDAWLGEKWGAWLPPKQARCDVVAMDPVVGGAYLVRMVMPDGRIVEISGRYKEIVRPTKLALTWKGDYHPHETLITVIFHADGDGTLMTLRQEGFAEAAMRDGYVSGWTGEGGSFDKLAQALAS